MWLSKEEHEWPLYKITNLSVFKLTPPSLIVNFCRSLPIGTVADIVDIVRKVVITVKHAFPLALCVHMNLAHLSILVLSL